MRLQASFFSCFRACLFLSICLDLATASGALAQSSFPVKMEFDVASVRQNKYGLPPAGDEPDSNFPLGPGDVFIPNGDLFKGKNLPLIQYISFAYKVTNNQASALRKQLPGWVTTDRFDIEAKTDKHDATKDEMRLMMRALLAERFKLSIHSESQQTPIYALVLVKAGKTGPKLQPHPADDTSCSTTPPPEGSAQAESDTVAGGFPVICGGNLRLPADAPDQYKMGARNVSVPTIAVALARPMTNLGRPVIDQTGLAGRWDFTLQFTPDPPPGVTPATDFAASGPALQQALKDQLGLKLESQKSSVDVWVVDRIERPSEN